MSCFGGEEVAEKKKAMWLYPKIMGFNPPERWGHSACYSNGFLYVYGGCCGGLHFSDVLMLNLNTMSWSKLVTTGQGPGPRDSHTAVLVEQKMIVFGGTNGTKKVSDIHILDLKSREWSRPDCKGIAPSPRESHTATLFGCEKLVIFGGSGEGAANYLNDLHVLDLKTMSWTSPQVKGNMPIPRDSHSAVAVGGKLFVYGGDCGNRYQGDVDMLDMNTMIWSRLVVHGPSPGTRAGHAAVSFSTKVLIIGGVGEKRYYNDVWVLDTSTCSWTKLEIRGQQPQGRFSHTAIVTDADIAIYGGCGEDERALNELLFLQLGGEHPNGRYNISMCKVFGSHYNKEKKRFLPDADINLKTTILGGNVEVLRNEDKETKPKLPFQLTSDTLHPKRRRTCNSKIYKIDSDPEEHSLSLSQHSSPSHSDQDQTPANKAACLANPAPLFPLVKQHSPASSNSQSSDLPRIQSDPRTIIGRPPQDFPFLEKLSHPKPEEIQNVVHNVRHSVQFSATSQNPLEAGQFQSPIGADVHGKVDGTFDSGYLMTATVNGRVFRGVLFSPGHQVISREVNLDQNFTSPAIQIMPTNPQGSHIDFLRHSQQFTMGQAPKPVHNFRQAHAPELVQNLRPAHVPEPIQNFRQAQVIRQSPVLRSSSSLGRDLKGRSELEGVVLTLGGPGNTGGS